MEPWLELLASKSYQILTKARQNLDAKQTLSHIESFKSQSSATTSHKIYVETSKFLSASVTSSQRSRKLNIAFLRRAELEQ